MGVYPNHESISLTTDLYHLHPQYVEVPWLSFTDSNSNELIPDPNTDNHLAILCINCKDCCTDGQPSKYSLKNGHDYGDLRRLSDPLKNPTIAENIAISMSRVYGVIIKLFNNSIQGQRLGMTSHLIAFPFPGAECLAERERLLFPRDAAYVTEWLKIQFVGNAPFRLMQHSLLIGLTQAKMDNAFMIRLLHILKTLNLHYKVPIFYQHLHFF